ncbi:MAG: M48 family metalloprotease [Deltaproteobacteria bacterium]|nr:M48 family metalloprotease [Deltaproteobacteria bacterium]
MGCATNPVTGKTQFMLITEEQEILIDRRNSPHQFSLDYGEVQDRKLGAYVERTGKSLARHTHRPHIPYRFKVVNATYVNAYAFPGGSVGITRGILLKLENEAELAALLGHELGHINARHTAEQMSKGALANLFVVGAATAVGLKSRGLGDLAATLGMLGAGMLLAAYSRDNEREADSLGMEYIVKGGYSPAGVVGLTDMLRGLSKRKPSAAQILFATHPMSDERYERALLSSRTRYADARKAPLYRERYMDNTKSLRAKAKAIMAMQAGESALAKKKYLEAEDNFKAALKEAPDDYAGLLMMSKCLVLQGRYEDAVKYAENAKDVYAAEAQAYHVAGLAKIKLKRYSKAYSDFMAYEKLLPGNPNTIFFIGLSLEGMQKTEPAAGYYHRYLQKVSSGEYARYAYRRLVQWGYYRR